MPLATYEYLASPYSDSDEEVMERRYQETMRATHWLLTHGIMVYSPIVHCHPMAVSYGLPRGHEFWTQYDEAMISGSHGIIVLTLPGWGFSKGVASELKLCAALEKLHRFMVLTDYGYDLSAFQRG